MRLIDRIDRALWDLPTPLRKIIAAPVAAYIAVQDAIPEFVGSWRESMAWIGEREGPEDTGPVRGA